MRDLILPDNPLFEETMAWAMQPGWQNIAAAASNRFAFCLRADGLMMPLSDNDLREYLHGGEYDEVAGDGETDDSEISQEIEEGWFIPS